MYWVIDGGYVATGEKSKVVAVESLRSMDDGGWDDKKSTHR